MTINRSIFSAIPSATYGELMLDDDGFQDVPVSSDELTDIPEIALEDLDYLRFFIIHSADYVEELESAICERSDQFWEYREHAYRIITGLLIGQWEARQ
jgi:hypothetical protein